MSEHEHYWYIHTIPWWAMPYCPVCEAEQGSPCVTPDGLLRALPHAIRERMSATPEDTLWNG